jgi:hypothetical protein
VTSSRSARVVMERISSDPVASAATILGHPDLEVNLGSAWRDHLAASAVRSLFRARQVLMRLGGGGATGRKRA